MQSEPKYVNISILEIYLLLSFTNASTYQCTYLQTDNKIDWMKTYFDEVNKFSSSCYALINSVC